MSDYTVVLDPTLEPICDPAVCKHPLGNRITVSRIAQDQCGKDGIEIDCTFCLCCGQELIGHMPWGRAFNRAWGKHGWHAKIAGRLWDLLLLRGHDGHLDWPDGAESELTNGERIAQVSAMTWRAEPDQLAA